MMYYYWTRKGIRPSVFTDMPERERLAIRAFYELELDEIKERKEAGARCPQLL